MNKKQKMIYLTMSEYANNNDNATLSNGLFAGDDKQIDFEIIEKDDFKEQRVYVYFEYDSVLITLTKKKNYEGAPTLHSRISTTAKELKTFSLKMESVKINGLEVFI